MQVSGGPAVGWEARGGPQEPTGLQLPRGTREGRTAPRRGAAPSRRPGGTAGEGSAAGDPRRSLQDSFSSSVRGALGPVALRKTSRKTSPTQGPLQTASGVSWLRVQGSILERVPRGILRQAGSPSTPASSLTVLIFP